MTEARLAELGDFEVRRDVEVEIETVRPDGVVFEDRVVLEDAQYRIPVWRITLDYK